MITPTYTEGLTRCYITDRKSLRAGETLLQAIARNLLEGPDWIQIREKDLSARELFDVVRSVLELSNPRGVKLLVNSRVDVALAAGADGVHLPAGSPPPRVWRKLVPPGFLIGVSCHSIAELQAAETERADYALFGPVFDPISKPVRSPAVGLSGLSQAVAAVKIPVLALGGITRENSESCEVAGAAGVAGISVFQSF